MSDREFDDELDLEMDRRLDSFARGTREPAFIAVGLAARTRSVSRPA